MGAPWCNYISVKCGFVSLLPECDFEENHLCGFVNRWNPNVNWFVGGGNIRNSHSILPQDHTLRSELGERGQTESSRDNFLLSPSCTTLI